MSGGCVMILGSAVIDSPAKWVTLTFAQTEVEDILYRKLIKPRREEIVMMWIMKYNFYNRCLKSNFIDAFCLNCYKLCPKE